MVEHKCPKCDKIFDRKSTYVYHMNRKNSCISEIKEIEFLKIKLEQQEDKIKELFRLLEINK